MPFIPDHTNYVDDAEHDENTWKYWFLVFGEGLFTLQKDAVEVAEHKDGMHVFLLCEQATRTWMRHCRRWHIDGCYESAALREHESDADSETNHDTEGAVACARVRTSIARGVLRSNAPSKAAKGSRKGKVKEESGIKKVKTEGAKEGCAVPASAQRAASVPDKHAASAPVKRGSSARTAAIKPELPMKEEKVPLYADMDNSKTFRLRLERGDAAGGGACPIEIAHDTCTVHPRGGQARPDATRPTPSVTHHFTHGHVCLIPVCVVCVYTSISCAKPVPAASVHATAAPPAARGSSAASRGTPSTHMFFNQRIRILYDNLELAMKDKVPGDPMEVVDAEVVQRWMSSLTSHARTQWLASKSETRTSVPFGNEIISTIFATQFNLCIASRTPDSSPPANGFPIDMPVDKEEHVHHNDEHPSPPPDDNNNSSSLPSEQHDKKCRVVDFAVKDSDWEDVVEGTLLGLGTMSHHSRNPQLPAYPVRKQRCRVVEGPNSCVMGSFVWARFLCSGRSRVKGKRFLVSIAPLDTIPPSVNPLLTSYFSIHSEIKKIGPSKARRDGLAGLPREIWFSVVDIIPSNSHLWLA
ncbi:hypothetical protein C8R45DRAFT_927382 [Mycena sanguinolenta]|nr:hypothetical protein C8R45DRAFT_927382 [Mycena sanguinolenta]